MPWIFKYDEVYRAYPQFHGRVEVCNAPLSLSLGRLNTQYILTKNLDPLASQLKQEMAYNGLLLLFYLWDRVLCRPGWPHIPYVAQDDFELLVLPALPLSAGTDKHITHDGLLGKSLCTYWNDFSVFEVIGAVASSSKGPGTSCTREGIECTQLFY